MRRTCKIAASKLTIIQSREGERAKKQHTHTQTIKCPVNKAHIHANVRCLVGSTFSIADANLWHDKLLYKTYSNRYKSMFLFGFSAELGELDYKTIKN